METYVVERYLPGATDEHLSGAAGRLAAAARTLAAEGLGLRYLGSTFVTKEEYCFSRFESDSADHVERACALADVPYARIVEARELDAPIESTTGREL